DELRREFDLLLRRDDFQQALTNRVFPRIIEPDWKLRVEGGLRRIADVKKRDSSMKISREPDRISNRGTGRLAEIVRNENVTQGSHGVLRANGGQASCRERADHEIREMPLIPRFVGSDAPELPPAFADFPRRRENFHSRCDAQNTNTEGTDTN